jgi:hypothetical protein
LRRRTNHVNAIAQMTAIDRRAHHVQSRAEGINNLDEVSQPQDEIEDSEEESFEQGAQWGRSHEKYHISKTGESHRLSAFTRQYDGDPATKVCFFNSAVIRGKKLITFEPRTL